MTNLSLPWWEFVIRAAMVYVFLLVMLRITGQRPSGPVAATVKFSRSQKRGVAAEVASASTAAESAGSSGYASTAANPAPLSRVS